MHSRPMIMALFVLTVSAVVAASGCGGSATPPASSGTHHPLSSNPADAIKQVQDAINAAPGYTIAVRQNNFVLPSWGGADSGTVEVGAHGTQAQATLARTGEQNATYAIFDTGTATVFQRSTCQQAFRISGQNVSVLNPYMLASTQAVGHATDASVDGSTITANVTGLGNVVIQVDPATSLPTSISGANASGPIVWTFKDWKAPDLGSPPSATTERGPGGIPC